MNQLKQILQNIFRNKRLKFGGVFILSLFIPICQIAAQSTEEPLTLQQSWQIVKENNLTLQQLEKSIQRANEEVAIQRSNYLPTLAITGSYNYVSELARINLPFQIMGQNLPTIEAGVNNQYDAAIVLKQPVFTGFRTRNLTRAAEIQVKAKVEQHTVMLNQLLFRVGQLFYQMQLNRLQQQVLQQSIQRVDVQLQKVRNLYSAKQATQFDTLEVFNRKLQIQSQYQKLQNIQSILESKYQYLLNQDSLPGIQTVKVDSLSLSLHDLQSYQEKAISNHPTLKQLSAVQEAKEYQIKAVRSVYFPQVFANATYHYARPGVNFFEDKWMDYYTVGINFQWEIWNWQRNKRKVTQAKLESQQLDLQYQQLYNDVRQQVNESYQYLLTTRDQIRLQQELVQQERKRYQLTSNKYQQGLATSLDLRDAEKTLTEAELLLQTNYMEWFQYRLQLDYTTGVIGHN